MKRSVLPVAALLVAGAFGAGQASAQTSASATANVSATVIGIAPLTATTVNDLDFGTVGPGVVVTVPPTNGARFLITGEPSFAVTVSFVLPASLAGPAGGTIPITFGNADGLLWAPFPTTFTTFNPNGAFAANMDGFGNLEVGITGTVSPPGGTVSGVYTGTITVTVAY
jgi:spore coat protein U-like protein